MQILLPEREKKKLESVKKFEQILLQSCYCHYFGTLNDSTINHEFKDLKKRLWVVCMLDTGRNTFTFYNNQDSRRTVAKKVKLGVVFNVTSKVITLEKKCKIAFTNYTLFLALLVHYSLIFA